MTDTTWMRMGMCAVVLLGLAGCQTLDRIGGAADSLGRMGESTAELAAASSDALGEVKRTVAVLDTHIEAIGEEVRVGLPRVVDSTTELLGTIERSTREMGEATTRMIQSSADAVEKLAPDVQATLSAVRETVTSTGKSLEAISERMDGTMNAIQALTASLEKSTQAGAEMLSTTQKELNAALLAAQGTLTQTSASLVRLEKESVTTLRSLQTSMGKLASTFDFMATNDDDAVISDLRGRVDSLVTLFLWVQILGALTIISVTVLFIHHKLTTRARHEAIARKLGMNAE